MRNKIFKIGISTVNLFESYSQNTAENFYYKSIYNDHWNVEGQKLAAKITAEFINTRIKLKNLN